MITRLWRGWTTCGNADAYENLLRAKILPGFTRVEGYYGAQVLRRDVDDGVEFVVLTRFASLEAIKAFAGENYVVAVISADARPLLDRFDPTALIYDTVITLE